MHAARLFTLVSVSGCSGPSTRPLLSDAVKRAQMGAAFKERDI